MELSILGILIFILDIWAIITVLKSRNEALMKLVWIVVILALPVVGMAVWFLVGYRKSAVI